MNNNAELLREIIKNTKPDLQSFSDDFAGVKFDPNKWSKKEILGHLIDSATNNHQRFIRAAQNTAHDFPNYDQNRWVEVNRYNERNWNELVDFFCLYNLFLSRIFDSLPQDTMNNLCNFGNQGQVRLEFVISDYIRHLKHHIQKILEN
jgi:hypothetical protein